MRAFVSLHDLRDRAVIVEVLRRMGCTDFVYDSSDAGGLFHYAAIQVFDHQEERMKYAVDETHPLMVDLRQFVIEHPDCYVLAITHFSCNNDGRTAFEQGADWWITESSLSLDSNWEHARASHDLQKGVPSWRKLEAASASIQESATT